MNDKTNSLYTDLQNALERLQEVLKESPTEIVQDATIQRFEFTFELAWKLMQSILHDNRIESFGVKSVFRGAAQLGLIPDPSPWLTFLESRNQTSHIYNAGQAHGVYLTLLNFPELVTDLLTQVPKY